MRLLSLVLFGWTFLSAATAATDNPSNGRSFGQAVEVGKIANHAIVELSGLACSRLNEKVLWAINDSGNQPLLFPVGSDGADLGSVSIIGADNRDWEDVASFMLGNTAYLLIADVGDNFGYHKSSTIYIIREPTITGSRLKKNITAKIAFRIRFIFEDGPRDCEAVAVDSENRKILLLTKRTLPVALYELPLELDKKEATGIARRIKEVPGIRLPSAMDISPQGNSAAVLTYHQAYLFVGRTGENWPTVFSRTPRILRFPALLQQEAICFSKNGKTVYVSSEGRSAPLLRIDLDAFTSTQ